jgi:hypothetical protein
MHLTFVFIALFGTILAFGLYLFDRSKSGKKVMSTIFDKKASENHQMVMNDMDESLDIDPDAMMEEDFWNN